MADILQERLASLNQYQTQHSQGNRSFASYDSTALHVRQPRCDGILHRTSRAKVPTLFPTRSQADTFRVAL